jgi:hypothetical protein
MYLDKQFRPIAEVINDKDEDKSPERKECEKKKDKCGCDKKSSQQQEKKKN